MALLCAGPSACLVSEVAHEGALTNALVSIGALLFQVLCVLGEGQNVLNHGFFSASSHTFYLWNTTVLCDVPVPSVLAWLPLMFYILVCFE